MCLLAKRQLHLATLCHLHFRDPDHSDDESRYITIGESTRRRLLIISHADRTQRIRIISAREVTRQERRIYENG